MITIDEAIVNEKERAEKNRNLTDSLKNDDIKKQCLEQANEHEQIAEWLEELKAYKEKEFDVLKQDGQLLYKQGVIDGYDKAIDDFIENAFKKADANLQKKIRSASLEAEKQKSP